VGFGSDEGKGGGGEGVGDVGKEDFKDLEAGGSVGNTWNEKRKTKDASKEKGKSVLVLLFPSSSRRR